jgi:membrane protease YdiL (CAAX protease family)
LLFALIHGILQFLPIFLLMAFLLAYSYRRSGTIVAPIVAHVLNNALFVVALAMAPHS